MLPDHVGVGAMPEHQLDQSRYFLKDTIRQQIDFSQTDQQTGIEPPPLEKPFPADARRFDLPPVGQWEGIETVALTTAIGDRQSRRSFKTEPLTLDELSFLLWATQGVRKRVDGGTVLRTVPSAGNRHSLETYVAVLRSERLGAGLLPLPTAGAPTAAPVPRGADAPQADRSHAGTNFRGQGGGGLYLDDHPVPCGVAVRAGRPQGDCPGRRACLSEPLSGMRGDRGWHLHRRSIPPAVDGPVGAGRRLKRVRHLSGASG